MKLYKRNRLYLEKQGLCISRSAGTGLPRVRVYLEQSSGDPLLQCFLHAQCVVPQKEISPEPNHAEQPALTTALTAPCC